MTDIFFSYSSKDRARVQPIRDALVDRGFSVFWDQEVPTSTDWDTWIRQHLNESKCALIIWSLNSITSDNVRHEAVIAKQQNKIVPVLLDAMAPDQFPMGLYAVQAANLCAWVGDLNSAEWLKLVDQAESKLTPAWIRRTLDTLEAELVAERSRRETAERRDRTLRAQIAKEAEARQQLHAELDHALNEVEQLKARVEAANRERGPDARTEELTRKHEAELVAEHSRVEAVESRERTLREQIVREAEERQQLQAGLDRALNEVVQFKLQVETADGERIAGAARTGELTRQREVAEEQRQALEQKYQEAQGKIVTLERAISELQNARRTSASPPADSPGVEVARHRETADLVSPRIRQRPRLALSLRAAALASAFCGAAFYAVALFNFNLVTYEEFDNAFGWAMKLGWCLSCVPVAGGIAWRWRASGRPWAFRCLAVPAMWLFAGASTGVLGQHSYFYGWGLAGFGVASLMVGVFAAGLAQDSLAPVEALLRCLVVGFAYLAGPAIWAQLPQMLWDVTFFGFLTEHLWSAFVIFGATFAFAGHWALAALILKELGEASSGGPLKP